MSTSPDFTVEEPFRLTASCETPILREPELDEEARKVFEPRYGRPLSDQEVWEIRFNLRNFALTIFEIAGEKKGGINAQSL